MSQLYENSGPLMSATVVTLQPSFKPNHHQGQESISDSVKFVSTIEASNVNSARNFLSRAPFNYAAIYWGYV